MDLDILKESNPWWDDKAWVEKDFHLSSISSQKIRWNYTIIENFDQGIYSLRGPRQVGKTSWIKQKIDEIAKNNPAKNICFFSCDNIDKDSLNELITTFLDISGKGKKYIFLDEIPFVEGWEFVIKHLYDSGRLSDCFLLLSGSNSMDIKRSIERLPGRGDKGKRHYTMLPLTFKEYLEAIRFQLKLTGRKTKDDALLKLNLKAIRSSYNDYLLTGGFLKIINEYHETKAISDSSYDAYLKWIIGDLAKLNLKERYAKQLLRRVIESYTSEISWSSLTSGTDIDTHNTSAKYAEALEEMFVLEIIYKLDFSKKIADYPKSKKIYFSDPFLISCVYKWVNSTDDNYNRYRDYLKDMIDKVSEGVILNHIIKALLKKNRSDVFNYSDVIYYWTNKAKTKEVDFVYDDIGVEVKYQNERRSSDYKGLKEFKQGYMITKQSFDKRTYPIAAFLLVMDRLMFQDSTT